MTSARWNGKSPQAVQSGVSSGVIDKDYDLEKRSSVSDIARAHKSRSEGKDISKQRGKQPGKLRNAGKLSKLPDMPIDIMYDVSYSLMRFVSIASDGRCAMTHRTFSDILFCPPDGSATNVVDDQGPS